MQITLFVLSSVVQADKLDFRTLDYLVFGIMVFSSP